MSKANFRPSYKPQGQSPCAAPGPGTMPGSPRVRGLCCTVSKQRVRRRRLCSRYPAGESARLLSQISTVLGAKPQNAAGIEREAPERSSSCELTASPARLLVQGELRGATGASALRCPAPRRPRPPVPLRQRRLLQQNPPPPNPQPLTNMALTVRQKKPFLSLQIPSCEGDRLCNHGRHGRGNPSSTDALFIRCFSIPRGGEAPPSSSSTPS